MWGNYLFFVTPDDYLISLDARTGKERWHREFAPFSQQYFSTMAPVVIGNHVLVGTSNDLDSPGVARVVRSGNRRRCSGGGSYTVPMNAGDPGLETWKNLDAARHGGGHPWVPGSYDPETHLYIFGTGNPTPAYTSQTRGEGDNLFTCALVAVNVDTGKMAWYYQTSPHDTHDWDSAQTPVLVDMMVNGEPRKLVLTASRNGYYFTVDRLTGEQLVTSKFSDTANWANGTERRGQPVRNPAKDYDVGGALVSASEPAARPTGRRRRTAPTPACSICRASDTYAMYYLTELDPRGAMGLGGKDERSVGTVGSYLMAIDYKTGKIVWRHKYRTVADGRGQGLLTTAGKLLFGGDPDGNFVAYDPANGTPLWHASTGQVSNAPETYMVDGRQYVIVAAGDTLFAFTVNP